MTKGITFLQFLIGKVRVRSARYCEVSIQGYSNSTTHVQFLCDKKRRPGEGCTETNLAMNCHCYFHGLAAGISTPKACKVTTVFRLLSLREDLYTSEHGSDEIKLIPLARDCTLQLLKETLAFRLCLGGCIYRSFIRSPSLEDVAVCRHPNKITLPS